MLWLWVVRDKLVPPIYEKPATEMVEIVTEKDAPQKNQHDKTEKTVNDSSNISSHDKSEHVDQSNSLLKNEDDDDRRWYSFIFTRNDKDFVCFILYFNEKSFSYTYLGFSAVF